NSKPRVCSGYDTWHRCSCVATSARNDIDSCSWMDRRAVMRNVVAERFIELLVIESYRPLNDSEIKELQESFEYLKQRQWQLKNMSLMAHMTNDTEWQHEICAEIEKLGGI